MTHEHARYRNEITEEFKRAVASTNPTLVAGTGGGRFADYHPDDLVAIPAALLESSFGCGNPVSFAAVKPGETVLDLGSGAGLDLLLAAERVGTSGRVIGIDMTDAMLERARANIKASGLENIEVRKGLIEQLPVDAASVDWVISNCVINLSAEKSRVFTEIARVLKPGGSMVVSDMVADDLPWWVKTSARFTAACVSGAISETAYLAGLQAAGLAQTTVLGRQYYDASQMASVVVDSLPAPLRNLRWHGRPLAQSLLTRAARPIAAKLYSAKIYARKPEQVPQADIRPQS